MVISFPFLIESLFIHECIFMFLYGGKERASNEEILWWLKVVGFWVLNCESEYKMAICVFLGIKIRMERIFVFCCYVANSGVTGVWQLWQFAK